MFDVGGAELAVAAVVVVAGLLAWFTWRQRWVRVAEEWHLDLPPAGLEDQVTGLLAWGTHGRLRQTGPDGWTWTLSRIPAWAVVVGVLTLPLGVLLLLLVREHADLHLHVRADGTGSRLRAVGRTSAGDAEAIAGWMSRIGRRAHA